MNFASKKVFVGQYQEEVDEEELGGVRAQIDSASRKAQSPAMKSPQKSKKVQYNATNVMSLDLPSLISSATILTGDMLRCNCGAVFSAVSKVDGLESNAKTWECEFCKRVNPFALEDEECPKTETVDYLLSGPKLDISSADEFTVLFVCDTSGSMCVTQPVEAGKIKLKGGAIDAEVLAFREHGALQALPNEAQGLQYVSRLQCVQAAIEAQILALKKAHPKCKVGVVSFSSDVVVIGDGLSAPLTIAGDRLNDMDGLIRAGREASAKLHSVSESADGLIQSIYKLTERGTTALGPAACVALGIMEYAVPGSKVVLCTDGMANMGVGNIEDAQGLDGVWNFYRDLAGRAKNMGIPISIISIAGSQCKMEILGSISEISGGDVDIIKAEEVLVKFANIAEEKVIATNVHLTLLLDSRMTVVDPTKPDFVASCSQKDVGTVTASSAATFEFKLRDDAVAGIKEDSLPFQVQIRYTRLDGSELMRVQTLKQSVTQNVAEAEADVNVSVVAQNAVQSAAEYASSGRYGKAREKMVLQQRLMQRASASPAYASPQQQQQQQQHYNAYVEQAAQLDDMLQDQERSEKPAPSMDEDAINSSRINARSDKLSNALYRAKSNRK